MTYRNWTCPGCGGGEALSGPAGAAAWRLQCRRCSHTVYRTAVPYGYGSGAWLVLVPDPLLWRGRA